LDKENKTTLDDDILDAVKVIIIIMIVILGIEYALSPLSFLQPYNDTLTGVFVVLQILLGAFAVNPSLKHTCGLVCRQKGMYSR